MKKIILSVAILLVLLLGAAIFLPYLFKDQIIDTVKQEANKSLKADLDFDQLSSNLLKTKLDDLGELLQEKNIQSLQFRISSKVTVFGIVGNFSMSQSHEQQIELD